MAQAPMRNLAMLAKSIPACLTSIRHPTYHMIRRCGCELRKMLPKSFADLSRAAAVSDSPGEAKDVSNLLCDLLRLEPSQVLAGRTICGSLPALRASPLQAGLERGERAESRDHSHPKWHLKQAKPIAETSTRYNHIKCCAGAALQFSIPAYLWGLRDGKSR